MRYIVGISNPTDHFVRFDGTIQNPNQGILHVQLPAWRPGRYELANYAKNIRGFEVKDKDGKPLAFQKITKDCWRIDANGHAQLSISYEYYANQPDAGASFASENLLYLNPVNCFMYVQGQMDDTFTVELQVPEAWKIACQLPHANKVITAPNFDALADSPFFASPNLLHHFFSIGSSRIHFWFEGGFSGNMAQLEADTRAYALRQIEIFKELPLEDYHFLYLMRPDKFRHGVEHCDSTVIAMGPTEELAETEFYHDFLAISSHELFHLWNIKRIRPEEMLPYDFTRENYSELGYVYEGVTTYYGDLMLLRSGVWDFERYANSLASDLDRHVNNPGRFNYSVAQSSFDTWLDGYTPGVKGRKVSIYIEGLVAAMVADIQILLATDGKYRLDEVLRRLYEESYLKGKGYNHQLYRQILEEVSGISFEAYFSDLIFGKGKWEEYLKNALKSIGLKMIEHADYEGLTKVEIVKFVESDDNTCRIFDIWSK